MKFIDEAKILVIAGKGGDGCLGFRREKYIPRGGPDGGDGGDGGSIFFQASSNLNTLVDFRYRRRFQAQNGRPGQGNLKTGKSGIDTTIAVPCGTRIFDVENNVLLGDLLSDGESILIAQGGKHGLGNTRFKSSTNRAPRKTTPGELGEQKELLLELHLLADVGLLGLPNAGKSTLIRAISNARPKVADYPFTTLHPNLGMCRVESDRSFVVADVPGLIKGAAVGVGMGIKFLKHLQRTKILLHIVDSSVGTVDKVINNIQDLEEELMNFDKDLAAKPQWIVLNKIDLIDNSTKEEIISAVKKKFSNIKNVVPISAINKNGTEKLSFNLMTYIEGNYL